MASRRTFPACENLEDRALARSPVTENYRLRTRTDTLVSGRFDEILFKTTPDVPLSGRRTEVKILEYAQRQCQPSHSASAHPGQTPYVFTNGIAAKSTHQRPDRLLVVHQTSPTRAGRPSRARHRRCPRALSNMNCGYGPLTAAVHLPESGLCL